MGVECRSYLAAMILGLGCNLRLIFSAGVALFPLGDGFRYL